MIAHSAQASAFDPGNPWLLEPDGVHFRFDSVFEDVERGLRVEVGQALFSYPDYAAPANDARVTYLSETGANIGFMRARLSPLEPLSVQFDVGAINDPLGDDPSVVLGAVSRLTLLSYERYRLAVHVGGRYSSSESRRVTTSFNSSLFSITSNEAYEREYLEYGAALLSTHQIHLHKENERLLQVYYGPRVSFSRDDYSYTFGSYERYFGSSGSFRRALSGSLRDSERGLNVFGLIVGANYQFSESISARVEARLFDEEIIGSENLYSTVVASY